MFQPGDRVVYGIHGVCTILNLECRVIDRRKTEYYVLEPYEQTGARFLVPTQNQAAVAKLRPVLSKQELDQLLCSEDAHQDAWISDENQRKQRYRELITSGDRAALICMVRSLLAHRQQQTAAGRKFHLCDENFLRDAQKLLSAEFSMILNIEPDQVGEYIKNKIEIN